MNESEQKSLREQLASKTLEADYYKRLAKEAGRRRLQETEALSKLTSTLRQQVALIENQRQQLEKLNQQIELVSVTDELTHLLNRRGFAAHAEREFANFLRRNHRGKSSDAEGLACAMLDIDHFKRINDTYGHDAGDRALAELGNIFRRPGLLRRTDIVARYGGEEFVLLMPVCSEESARIPLNRIWLAIQNTSIEASNYLAIKMTVSIGVSGVRTDDGSVFEAIARADRALYFAKENGRNQILFHSEALSTKGPTEK